MRNFEQFTEAVNVIEDYAKVYGRHSTTCKAIFTFLDAVEAFDKACEVLEKESTNNVGYFLDLASAYEEKERWTTAQANGYSQALHDMRINDRISDAMNDLQEMVVKTLDSIAEKIEN